MRKGCGAIPDTGVIRVLRGGDTSWMPLSCGKAFAYIEADLFGVMPSGRLTAAGGAFSGLGDLPRGVAEAWDCVVPLGNTAWIEEQQSEIDRPFKGFGELSAGATYLRADLHIHTYGVSPDVTDSGMTPENILETAQARHLDVIAVTDHNAIDGVEPLLAACAGSDVAAFPGVELTTGEGHVLVYFAPEHLAGFKKWFSRIDFEEVQQGERYTLVPILDVLKDVAEAGGIAIPAHISRSNTGFLDRVSSQIEDAILISPHLRAVEIDEGVERNWYSDMDAGDGASRRSEILKHRLDSLGEGVESRIAKLLFSDAHSLEAIGRDREGRERVTRIKMSTPTFDAFRTALVDSDARIKLEADLPSSYPRIEGVRLIGGFLDGQEVALSPNLTCLIGGRGTGKSTLLESIRCTCLSVASEMDGQPNCPETVQLIYRDAYGTSHYLKRDDARRTYEVSDGGAVEISLPVEGYDQDRIALITREYRQRPRLLLEFLDQFVDLKETSARIDSSCAALRANSDEIKPYRSAPHQLAAAKKELEEVRLKLKAIENSNLKEALDWRRRLYQERQVREELEARLKQVDGTVDELDLRVDLGGMVTAAEVGDLSKTPSAKILLGDSGEKGLVELVEEFSSEMDHWKNEGRRKVTDGLPAIEAALERWRQRELEIEGRVQTIVTDLRAKDINPKLSEMTRLATAEAAAAKKIRTQEAALEKLKALEKERKTLVQNYKADQARRFQLRRIALQDLTNKLNDAFDDFKVKISIEEGGLIDGYGSWVADALAGRFLRKERVSQLCAAISPIDLAALARDDQTSKLAALRDQAGTAYFSNEAEAADFAEKLRECDLDALEHISGDDLPEISLSTQVSGQARKVDFGNLSLGQKASILLGALLFSSDQTPLLIDQPEDHLDSQFISRTVVRVLRQVKEKRQVIIATHNANIAVLGDAEQIVPLQGYEGRGLVRDSGSVDAMTTRARACEILEGGEAAYRRRGEMYGLELSKAPSADAAKPA
jgi:ABC-type cobalamin/Fe3+-siderophores transport system ATPase subunit